MNEMNENKLSTLPAELRAKIDAMPFEARLTKKAKVPSRQHEPDEFLCTLRGIEFPYSKGVMNRIPGGRFIEKLPWPIRTMEDEAYWEWSVPVLPDVYELLAAVVLDARCADDCVDIDAFNQEFGPYNKVSVCLRAWDACNLASKLLRAWFTDDEREALGEWANEL